MDKVYNRINWQNQPSTATALGATNLNRMDIAVDAMDNRIIQLDTGKLNRTDALALLNNIEIDTMTGVIKVTKFDGTILSWDLNLEKIPAKLYMTEDAVLVMETDDGQSFSADLKKLIDTYIFDDSGTIAFSMESDSSGKHVTGIVKNGCITNDHLAGDYLADITEQQLLADGHKKEAEQQALVSKRYAVGGVIPEDVSDNSKYYAEQSKHYKELAEQAANLVIPDFSIDLSTGELVSTKGNGIAFFIDANGFLCS